MSQSYVDNVKKRGQLKEGLNKELLSDVSLYLKILNEGFGFDLINSRNEV